MKRPSPSLPNKSRAQPEGRVEQSQTRDLHGSSSQPLISEIGNQQVLDMHRTASASKAMRQSRGMPLPEKTRRDYEHFFGSDLSTVRIHTDTSAQASSHDLSGHAFSQGKDVYFADGQFDTATDAGRRLLAHELAHTLQQNDGSTLHRQLAPAPARATHTVVAGETLQDIARDIYGEERYADAIRRANPRDVTVVSRGVYAISAGAVLVLPNHPDRTDPWVTPDISDLLRNGGVWTSAQAEAALRAFTSVSAAQRDAMIAHYLPFGHLDDMLVALPDNSTQAGGSFERQTRDLLQRVQRVGARADAAAQGLVDETAMAQAQANEMTARNRAAAIASGIASPTTAQIAAQQSAQVAAGSIATQTAVMTAAQEATINNTLNATSIPNFITWATANHPELGLTAAHLRASAREIFERGVGIIAFADGTRLRAVVGEPFLLMVAANPAYALPTVVHEIWGHNTYEGRGRYGSPGAAYGLDIYDRAARLMPGYRRPGSAGRSSEIDNYGYHETEMYSLMREVPYYTPNAPAHAALNSMNYDPAPEIESRIQQIHDVFEVRVARAQLRGLYLRFLVDPTVGAAAMNAFRDGVNAVFPAADAAAILA